MRKLLLFSSLVFMALSLTAQAHYQVIAPSGLFLRDMPARHGTRLGKLPVGASVELLERSGQRLTVQDDGQDLTGEWVKVQHPDFPAGYVFDGYLLPQQIDPQSSIGCDDQLPCDTHVPMGEVALTFFQYQAEGLSRKSPDTLFIYEYVFNNLTDKLIHIRPEVPLQSVQLFMTLHETITHQYDPLHPDAPLAQWQGAEPFREIKGDRGFFRIPSKMIDENQETFRQQQLGLRDTLVDHSGESWDVATLIYAGKPSLYVIDELWLKLLLTYPDGRQRAQYLRVELSYGC